MRPPIINVMDGAARKATRSLIHDFGEVEQLQVSRKGPADFVSEADRRAEEILRRELGKARPEFAMLLEEAGAIGDPDSENRWIVDPLDGTTNFLHGIPHFAISIGLERDGKMFAGVIYDPLRDELFWAEVGGGAFLNAKRLRVSSRERMSEALIATGMPFRGRASHPEYPDMLDRVRAETSGVRRFGSAALNLAYVAAGRYDGLWEFALSPWDIAAGLVILREAGGIVSEVDGGDRMMESGDILATNGRLHEKLQNLLANAAAASG